MLSLTRPFTPSDRTLISNIPFLKDDDTPNHPTLATRLSLSDIVLTLNPTLYEPPHPSCTREEAKHHIESIDQLLDLLKRLLHLDATKRLTAEEALGHEFLREEGMVQRREVREVGEGVCGHLHEVLGDMRRE